METWCYWGICGRGREGDDQRNITLLCKLLLFYYFDFSGEASIIHSSG